MKLFWQDNKFHFISQAIFGSIWAACRPSDHFGRLLQKAWQECKLGIILGAVFGPIAGTGFIAFGMMIGGVVGGIVATILCVLAGALAGLDWIMPRRKKRSGPFGRAAFGTLIFLTVFILGFNLLQRVTLSCERVEPSQIDCRQTTEWLALVTVDEQTLEGVRGVTASYVMYAEVATETYDHQTVQKLGRSGAARLSHFIASEERAIVIRDWGGWWLPALFMATAGIGLAWVGFSLRSAFRLLQERLQLKEA
jgi:hypothetical protein